jgi:monoamine oxidase
MGHGLIARMARQAGATPSALTRREMLQASLALGASLMLGQRPGSARATIPPRVVIIGAGFGGLSCGYQLARAGARVNVVEARPWVGGRVHSLTRFVNGQIVEAGGEFIGLHHSTWLTYARRFGLSLREVAQNDEAASPIVLQGRRYLGPEVSSLWTQIEAVLQAMTKDASQVDGHRPWQSTHARTLDLKSLQMAAQRWPGGPLERHGALTLLANELSCRAEASSYLALLASIAAGGMETFWTEREVYRCTSGNQSLAQALAAAIGAEQIRLRSPVREIRLDGTHPGVILESGERLEADAVVLATPPSTWTALKILPALPKDYWMSTGAGIKVLCRFNQPFWKDSGLEPVGLSDGEVGLTWQAGEPEVPTTGKEACLSMVAGGKAAEAWLRRTSRENLQSARRELDLLFPGLAAHLQKGSVWLWPKERWTGCCASVPAPGEVTTVSPRLDQGWQERLFFAGECVSPGFHGRMEGGLHSGARLAEQLARRLNMT